MFGIGLSRVRRRLRDAKPTPIEAVTGGAVTLVGVVELAGGRALRAPFSGRRCVVYDAAVLHHRFTVRDEIIHDRVAFDFLLVDATGVALVRAGSAPGGPPGSQLDLAIAHEVKHRTGIEHPPPNAELERFLSIYGESSRVSSVPRRLSFREGVIEPGQRVVVCGAARREADPDPAARGGGYRERPMRVVIEPLEGKILVSSAPDVVARVSG